MIGLVDFSSTLVGGNDGGRGRAEESILDAVTISAGDVGLNGEMGEMEGSGGKAMMRVFDEVVEREEAEHVVSRRVGLTGFSACEVSKLRSEGETPDRFGASEISGDRDREELGKEIESNPLNDPRCRVGYCKIGLRVDPLRLLLLWDESGLKSFCREEEE